MNLEKSYDLTTPKIILFDLDNTLCNTEGNYYEAATPKQDRIDYVNKLYDDGHTIIIDTARGCVSGRNWFYFTVEQLKGWGVKIPYATNWS